MGNINANGRTKHGRFVALPYAWLEHDAWKDMSVHARVLFVELRRRFNGVNNGEISMSHREAAALLHCSKNSPKRYFNELVSHGFVKPIIKGRYQNRHASTWAMTCEPLHGTAPTNDWKRYEKKKIAVSGEVQKVPHIDLNSIQLGTAQ
jgi:hypothetical protein